MNDRAAPALRAAERDSIPTRVTLLHRLGNWADSASWEEFHSIYHRLILNYSVKNGLDAEEAEDVVQDTLVTVAKNIGQFERRPGKGGFKAWLLNTTRWRIRDQFRKRLSRRFPLVEDRREEPGTDLLNRIPDTNSDRVWDNAWMENLTEVAMARLRSRVDARQLQIYDLYVLRGLPAREVAQALDVSAASVYLARHRINLLLRKEIKTLERPNPGLLASIRPNPIHD